MSGVRIFAMAMILGLAACGSRALKGTDGDAATAHEGNEATGAAGTTGTPGAAGTTADTGVADTTGQAGVTGAAGQGGAAGAMCGLCPPADCKPGFMPVTNPAVSCCAICRPVNCTNVRCAAVPCPAGNHVEMLDVDCCPTCLPGVVSVACTKGRANYAVQSEQLFDKYDAGPCQSDSDCALVVENNACARSCARPINANTVSFAGSNLDSFAIACATCPMPAIPPCAQLAAFCSNGRCVVGAAPPGQLDAGAALQSDAGAPACTDITTRKIPAIASVWAGVASAASSPMRCRWVAASSRRAIRRTPSAVF